MSRRRFRERARRGSALLYAVLAAFAVTTVVSVAMTFTMSSSRSAAIDGFGRRATFLAEGGLDVAARDVADALARHRRAPTSGAVEIDGVRVRYEVRAGAEGEPAVTSEGLRTGRRAFQLEARAAVQGVERTERAAVDAVSVPLFQFGVFHHADLELAPEGDLTLEGRAHANGDVWLDCGGTLTLDTNRLTAAGHLRRGRKPGLEPQGGAVRIRRWVARPSDPAEPHELAELASPMPSARSALSLWSAPEGYGRRGHTVKTRSHGVRPVSAPGAELLERDGFLHRAAGLAIVTQPDLSFRVTTADGADVTDAFPGAIEVGELYDARQAGTSMAKVLVTRVDLARLAELGGLPANGLVWAGWSSSGTGTRSRGIELVNGARLAAPLTVATENALYVRGDFNALDPVPAALMGDAVNLLSNAWDGAKERGELPRAAPTTYNAALFTGEVPTDGARYGGGVENLARLHEDWSGVALRLRGALVCAFESRYATGPWQSGEHYYHPPVREFAYETGFDGEGGLPPFAPSAVTTRARPES